MNKVAYVKIKQQRNFDEFVMSAVSGSVMRSDKILLKRSNLKGTNHGMWSNIGEEGYTLWKLTKRDNKSAAYYRQQESDRCYDLEMFSVAPGRARLHYQTALPANFSLIVVNSISIIFCAHFCFILINDIATAVLMVYRCWDVSLLVFICFVVTLYR